MKTFISELLLLTIHIIIFNVVYELFDFSTKSLLILAASMILAKLLILEDKLDNK